VSDLAVDNKNNVFTAATPGNDPTASFVQRLNASASMSTCGNQCPPAEIVRWSVGGGAGSCVSSPSGPCIAGLAVHPKFQNLVYVVRPTVNEITEIDTNSKISCPGASCKSKTRSWKLPPDVNEPRQLSIDSDGIVAVITGSQHIAILNTKTNRITTHEIPPGVFQDPFGIASDLGTILYTTNETGVKHKVAMLIPKGQGLGVTPSLGSVPRDDTLTVQPDFVDAVRESNSVRPFPRTVPTEITTNQDGSTFVEALVDKNTKMTETRRSMLPLGITPDRDKAVGAAFYAVGETEEPMMVNRVGFARLPLEYVEGKKYRDDEDWDDDGIKRGVDDDDDDDGIKNWDDNDDDNDGILDMVDDDDDNDGIKNQYDTKDGRESQDNYSSDLAVGQAEDFPVTAAPGTLALIATAASSDLLSPVSIEILNAAGQVVASTLLPTVGVAVITIVPTAGDYIVRVKNQSTSTATIATRVITRVPWVF
jgi:hypothetical protein